MPTALWALLVGIDQYEERSVPTLRGCANDILAMSNFLKDRLSADDIQVRLLLNENAKRQTILDTFRDFLIENPAIQAEDQVLFMFSGHGSTYKDEGSAAPNEEKQTIVAYDSRSPGGYDIPDMTTAALLRQLEARHKDHITVILDCCHSGSGTRTIDNALPLARYVKPADEALPSGVDAEFLAQLVSNSARSLDTPTAEEQRIGYTSLGACSSIEKAYEYSPDKKLHHGVFTYFLIQALQNISSTVTYTDLRNQVAHRVQTIYSNQTPQCEGIGDRVVFGDQIVSRDAFIDAEKIDDDHVRLKGGVILELTEQTQVALYPDTVRTRAALPAAPLATAEVTESLPLEAHARVIERLAPLPDHLRAIITRFGSAPYLVMVQLRSDDQPASTIFSDAITALVQEGKEKSHIRSAEGNADVIVAIQNGQSSMIGTDGYPLVDLEKLGVQTDSPEAIYTVLERYGRYYSCRTLENRDKASRIGSQLV
ncbi:MAG: caspase family protein, partial [Chloroflexota bacterium]